MAITKRDTNIQGLQRQFKRENLWMQFITPIDAAKALEKSTAVHDENSKMISRRERKLITFSLPQKNPLQYHI